jgi:hypothetical protein
MWVYCQRAATARRAHSAATPQGISSRPIGWRDTVRRRLRIVPQRLAQHTDGFGERRIGNERVLPDGLDQVLFRNDLTRFGHEEIQNRKHPRRKRELLVSVMQQPVASIVKERAEGNRPGAGATCFDLSSQHQNCRDVIAG